MTDAATATVEVLTAQVRVLVVGSRQVTLSAFRQLDQVWPTLIEPFGRVHANPKAGRYDLEVVGRDPEDGTLCRSAITSHQRKCDPTRNPRTAGAPAGYRYGEEIRLKPCGKQHGLEVHEWTEYRCNAIPDQDASEELDKIAGDWDALPLIVLAGLR